MTDTATAAFNVKRALYQAAQQLYDDTIVNVAFGATVEDRDRLEMVTFLELTANQEQGPLSSSNRSRDEDVEVVVVFSVFRAGDPDDLGVSEQAYANLRTLEQYVRKTNTTLDGACMWCFLASHNSYGYTDQDLLNQGRLIEIEATFRARVRITG